MLFWVAPGYRYPGCYPVLCDRLKSPTSGRVEYWDNQLPGFGLRVSDSGRKSWVALYRANGKLIRETIGTVALIPSVADARERARESMQAAQKGMNPVEQRREAKRAAIAAESKAPASTFSAVADRYMVGYVEKNTRPATTKETRRILDRDVKPRWGGRQIASITRQDIGELLDEIAGRGAMVQANRTLARLKTLFSWALDEEIVTSDPTLRVRQRVKEAARDRALSQDEIRLFWFGCDAANWPFGPIFKLLLLTAQRRDEVGMLEWSEIDLGNRVWTIPRERSKNDRAHNVHLSALAVEIIEGLPKLENESRFVFTTTGHSPVSGFSRAKAALDDRMRGLVATAVEPWILHDLRRTAATGMAGLGIAPHVVDRILNHVSGTIRGVAAVYNRHAYLEERKAALEAWGRHVESLIRPRPMNVIPLVAAR